MLDRTGIASGSLLVLFVLCATVVAHRGGNGTDASRSPRDHGRAVQATEVNRPDAPPVMSLVRLIAVPERYHGRFVAVSGYLHVRFEDCALYLLPDSGPENAVWVSFAPDPKPVHPLTPRPYGMRIKPQSLDSRRLVLYGTFDADSHGHMGAFAGELKGVTSFIERSRQ